MLTRPRAGASLAFSKLATRPGGSVFHQKNIILSFRSRSICVTRPDDECGVERFCLLQLGQLPYNPWVTLMPEPLTTAPSAASLFGSYRPSAGVYDESALSAGIPRPHWRHFLSVFESLGREELAV